MHYRGQNIEAEATWLHNRYLSTTPSFLNDDKN